MAPTLKKATFFLRSIPASTRPSSSEPKATWQQIEAHLRRLKKEYERARNLLMKGSVSQEEFDRYESDFKETQGNLEIAKANRDLAALNLDWTEVRRHPRAF